MSIREFTIRILSKETDGDNVMDFESSVGTIVTAMLTDFIPGPCLIARDGPT